MFAFRKNVKIDRAREKSLRDAQLSADVMAQHYRAAAGRVDSVGMPAAHSGRSNTQRLSAPEEKPVQRNWRKAAAWTTTALTAALSTVVYLGSSGFEAVSQPENKIDAATAPVTAKTVAPVAENATAPAAVKGAAPATSTGFKDFDLPDVPHIKLPSAASKPETATLPAAKSPVTVPQGGVTENNLSVESVVEEKFYSPVTKVGPVIKEKITDRGTHLHPVRTYRTVTALDICKAIVGESSDLTSDFGDRVLRDGKRTFHEGLDCRAPHNKPVYALFDGRVAYAGNGYNKGFGNMVQICGKSSVCAIYAHANALTVRMGSYVRAGEKVMLAGATGHTDGPHVHFEMRRYGPQDGKRGSPVNLPAEPRLAAELLPGKPGIIQNPLSALRAGL